MLDQTLVSNDYPFRPAPEFAVSLYLVRELLAIDYLVVDAGHMEKFVNDIAGGISNVAHETPVPGEGIIGQEDIYRQ